MKKYLFIMLFSFSIICLSKADNTEFKFIKSEAVRFAKIAIKGENCDTVLELIFDESDGLGTGFDTLYILQNKDVNIDGRVLARSKIKIKAKEGFGTSYINDISESRYRNKRKARPTKQNKFEFCVRVRNVKLFNSNKTDLNFTISTPFSKATNIGKLNSINRREFDCKVEIEKLNLDFEAKIKTDINLLDAPINKFSAIPKISYYYNDYIDNICCWYYIKAGDFTIDYDNLNYKEKSYVDATLIGKNHLDKRTFQVNRIQTSHLKKRRGLSKGININIPNTEQTIYRLISSFNLPFYKPFVVTNDIKILNATYKYIRANKCKSLIERKSNYKLSQQEKKLIETAYSFAADKISFDKKNPPTSYTNLMVEIDTEKTLINYVSKTGKNISPYVNLEDAATDIQAAINVANSGNTILVNEGIYTPFGKEGFFLNKNIILKSINGPKKTFIIGSSGHKTNIFGYGATRCVKISGKAEIHGFTISNGYSIAGGGIYCEDAKVFNCIIEGNVALSTGGGIDTQRGKIYNCIIRNNTAKIGGGAFLLGTKHNNSSIYNCIISKNNAERGGGVAASDSLIRSCTIVENEANSAGGINLSGKNIIKNSIIYYNKRFDVKAHPQAISDIDYCCMPFFPKNISHNITNLPAFFEKTFYLSERSPCINAGNNSYVISENDISDRKRIFDKQIDIGASEFILTPLTITALQKNISNDISKISVENQEKAWIFIHKAEKEAANYAKGKFPLSIKTFRGENYNFQVKKHSAYNKKILETYIDQIYKKFGIKNK